MPQSFAGILMDKTIQLQYPGYDQALSTAALYRVEDPGYFRIAGDDQRAFLQRQTTNDVERVASGTFLSTVLTSPTARILDVLEVFEEGDLLGVLSLPGQISGTIKFLQSRIFFTDKVTIEDLSRDYVQLVILGPKSGALLSQLSGVRQLDIGGIKSVEMHGTSVRILHPREHEFRLLIPADNAPQLVEYFLENDVPPLSKDVFNILRVEAGIPTAGHELTDDYTPLETGLRKTISEDKGCYTGQEVIARQINYDKITRHLVGLQVSEASQLGESLYALDSNQPTGKITSLAESPRFGPIALAVVRRPYDKPGSELRIGNEGNGIRCVVCSLPFQTA
jgi:folate-binding protein YgfZ